MICLAIAAFLAPVAGGHVPLERSSLEPGFSNLFMAAVWSFDAPSLAHMLLGLLVVAAQSACFVRRQVVQLPGSRLLAPLLGFFALLVFSVAVSSFKMQSLSSLAEWLVYGCTFLAVVACAGRSFGPRLLLTCIFAGCVVAALRGLVVDAQMSGRIFGGWQHPNALAGILLVGLLIGCGLAMTSERLEALGVGAGITLISVALALTQSKGGYLAAAVGVLAFALILLGSNRKLLFALAGLVVLSAALYLGGVRGLPLLGGFLITMVAALAFVYQTIGKKILNVAIPLAFTAFLIAVMVLKPPAEGGGAPVEAPFARVAAPAASGDQSVRYRLNLWASAIELTKSNFAGTGLNTYQYHSAKPGIVGAGTVYAHQSFLQLMAEASPLSIVFLALFLAVIFREVTRGISKAPPELKILRCAVFATLIAATAQSLFESQLYIMGFGLVYFMLCGIALQLSYDGSAPELVPKEARWILLSTSALIGIMVVYFGAIGTLKARVNADLAAGDFTSARIGADRLLSMATTDGQVHFLNAMLAIRAGDAEGAVTSLSKATRYHPAPRYYRTLARLLHETQRTPQALLTLDKVLLWDPNNWDALDQKLEIQKESGDEEGAKETAQQLVAIEQTPAFKVRPLPETIPLEIYRAHAYLASVEADPSKKMAELQAAMDGYYDFAWFTVHNINNGTITKEEGIRRAEEGSALAEQLVPLYRVVGKTKEAERAEYLKGEFDKLVETLQKMG